MKRGSFGSHGHGHDTPMTMPSLPSRRCFPVTGSLGSDHCDGRMGTEPDNTHPTEDRKGPGKILVVLGDFAVSSPSSSSLETAVSLSPVPLAAGPPGGVHSGCALFRGQRGVGGRGLRSAGSPRKQAHSPGVSFSK